MKTEESQQLRAFLDGGADRDRTCDLLIANETLYQLSYDPIHRENCKRQFRGKSREPCLSRPRLPDLCQFQFEIAL